jgi:hypothetical protein
MTLTLIPRRPDDPGMSISIHPETGDAGSTSAPVLEPEPQAQPPAQPVLPQPKRHRRRTIAIAVAAIVVVAIGGGAVFANGSLSATYSASRAVTDYLAAMSRGDVTYMLANANYPKGQSGPDDFFGPASVTAMMGLSENRSIRNVRVTSDEVLDSITSKVTASMTWDGKERSQTYTLHKDATRQHYAFYYSWRIDIPESTITVTLPAQPGGVGIDGIYGQAVATVSVIQGFHTVSMHETDFYDQQSELVDARGDVASAAFPSTLNASAMNAAAEAIKEAFQSEADHCDARNAIDCVNHRYTPAAGYYEVLEMPGGNVDAYTTWTFTYTGDPTAGMKVVVDEATGKVTATGTCQMQLVADGSRKYRYHGPWSFTLTWSDTVKVFGWDGQMWCDKLKG